MSTDTPAITTYRINQKLKLLSGAVKSVDNYRKLLALATELGEEYEIERLTSTLREIEDDEEELREQLILLGYQP